MMYRLDSELWPHSVKGALYLLKEAIQNDTDWDGAQITIEESVTIDVRVNDGS